MSANRRRIAIGVGIGVALMGMILGAWLLVNRRTWIEVANSTDVPMLDVRIWLGTEEFRFGRIEPGATVRRTLRVTDDSDTGFGLSFRRPGQSTSDDHSIFWNPFEKARWVRLDLATPTGVSDRVVMCRASYGPPLEPRRVASVLTALRNPFIDRMSPIAIVVD